MTATCYTAVHQKLTEKMKNSSMNMAPNGSMPAIRALKHRNQTVCIITRVTKQCAIQIISVDICRLMSAHTLFEATLPVADLQTDKHFHILPLSHST